MSATIDPLLIPRTKQTQAIIELEHENGRAPDPCGRIYFWRRNLRVGDFTPESDGAQTINLFSGVTAAALARAGQSGDFPANAWINIAMGPYLRLVTPFSGGSVSAVTIEFGDADLDGLLTASNVFTGVSPGIIRTTSAAEFAPRPETGYVPSATLRTTDDDIADLTAGECEIVIPYTFMLRDI